MAGVCHGVGHLMLTQISLKSNYKLNNSLNKLIFFGDRRIWTNLDCDRFGVGGHVVRADDGVAEPACWEAGPLRGTAAQPKASPHVQ